MFQRTCRLMPLLAAMCLLSQQAHAIPITHEIVLTPGAGSTDFLGAPVGSGPFTATLVLETGGAGFPTATDTLVIDASSIVSFDLMIGAATWDETLLDFTGASTGVATAGVMTGTTLSSLVLSAETPSGEEFLTIDLTNDPNNWSAVSIATGETMIGTNSGDPTTGGVTVNSPVIPNVAGVPEPVTATLGLMSLGLLGLATKRRRVA